MRRGLFVIFFILALLGAVYAASSEPILVSAPSNLPQDHPAMQPVPYVEPSSELVNNTTPGPAPTAMAAAVQPFLEESAVSHGADMFEVDLKSRTFTPAPGISQKTLDAVSAMPAGRVHMLVQLDRIPTIEEKASLRNQGINLLIYIPQNSWIASMERSMAAGAVSIPSITWVGSLEAADKMADISRYGVSNYARNQDGTVTLVVVFYPGVSEEEARGVMAKYGSIDWGRGMLNDYKLTLEGGQISALAAEDTVRWIEDPVAPDGPQNGPSRNNTGVNILQAAPYSLSGINIKVGIWDGGNVSETHPALVGRVTNLDNWTVSDHATHVTGTVGCNGSLSANDDEKGMAPNVTFFTYTFYSGNDEPEEHQPAVNTYNIQLSQNSWGLTLADCSASHGNYRTRTAKYDNITRGFANNSALTGKIPIMFSAGNDYNSTCPFNTTTPPGGTAKNVIVVGANDIETDAHAVFSSTGPTDDGRIKPDIMAPGDDTNVSHWDINSTIPAGSVSYDYPYDTMHGTSMASPVVSGVVALMLEKYNSTHNGEIPLPATFKALLLHTAKDINLTGPDFSTGYGRMNATYAVDLIIADNSSNNTIREEVISNQDETDYYQIIVPAGASQLKITLAWDDYPGPVESGRTLVNNLDLRIQDPNGVTYYPWTLNVSGPDQAATTGIDDINNVEQVIKNSPAAGNWTVYVWGKKVPQAPQNYSLVTDSNLSEKSCLVPFDGVEIDTSVTLCNGAYSLSDGGDNGVMILTGSNLTLDCNSAKLTGTGSGYGIRVKVNTTVKNVTIQNCNFSNYSTAIDVGGLTSNPITYRSMTGFIQNSNIEYSSIGVNGDSWTATVEVSNCNFSSNHRGIRLLGAKYNISSVRLINTNSTPITISDTTHVENNTIINSSVGEGILVYGDANRIRNNTIKNVTIGIWLSSADDNNVSLNNVTNATYGIRLTGTAANNSIYNNFLNASLGANDSSTGGGNVWNTTYNCSLTSIVGGCMGGNYYSDASVYDDRSGSTSPYNISGDYVGDNFRTNGYSITGTGGGVDYLPLTNNTCTNVTEGLSVTTDIYICYDEYSIADAGNNGVIIPNANGVTLDCRNASVIGTGVGYGLNTLSRTDLIIKNCMFSNYSTGLRLANTADNATLISINLTNNTYGIHLYYSHGANISNSLFSRNNIGGVYLEYANRTLMQYSKVHSNGQSGLWLITSNSTFINLSVYNHTAGEGIELRDVESIGNTFQNISAYSNGYGFYFNNNGFDSTTIRNSTIYDSVQYGIYIEDGSDNGLIYNNNFTNNSVHVFDNGTGTLWNTTKDCTSANIIGGSCIGGNYFDDYTGKDINNDSIGDTAYYYLNPSGAYDYLPLTLSLADGLIVNWTNKAPASVYPNTQNVTILNMNLTCTNVSNGKLNLTWLNVTRIGTCLDADVQTVRLWNDSDNDGNWTSTDPLIGSASFSSGVANISGFNFTIENNSFFSVVLTYDFEQFSTSGCTAGARIINNSKVGVNGNNVVGMQGFPVQTGNVSVVGIDYLNIQLTGGAPANATQADENVTLLGFYLNSSSLADGVINVSVINVTQSGNASDDAVWMARLWNDTDSSGNHSAGDTLIDNLTPSGGIIQFSGFNLTVTNATPLYLVVTYDIRPNATAGNTLGAKLAGSSSFAINSPNLVNSSNLPMQGNNTTTLALSCTYAYDDVYINSDTTLCYMTMKAEDNGATGVLIINKSNVVLDCNNSLTIDKRGNLGKFVYGVDKVNITIQNCNLTDFSYGVYVDNFTNSTIENNFIGTPTQGISLGDWAGGDSNTYNKIINNIIYGSSYYSIMLMTGSNDNNVSHNYLYDSNGSNEIGIYFVSSHNNTFADNNITNVDRAIFYSGGDEAGNLFYHNNFVNNSVIQVSGSPGGNYYNSTIWGYAQGNYWSDISQNSLNMTDTSGNGIYDSGSQYPYNNTSGNVTGAVYDWGPFVNIGGWNSLSPPAPWNTSGNVTGSTTCTNEVHVFNTVNLTIFSGGSLTMSNCTIVMNATHNGSHQIIVNGSMNITANSNITNGDTANAYYKFRVNSSASSFEVHDSLITGAGWADGVQGDNDGLYITMNRATIENSTIHSADTALSFDSSGNHTVVNNTLNGTNTGIFMSSAQSNSFDNNVITGRSNGDEAARISSSSDYNNFTNNTFKGATAIVLVTNSNNRIIGGVLNSTLSTALQTQDAVNVTVANATLISPSKAFWLANTGNVTVLNCSWNGTLDLSLATTATLNISWYIDFNVTNSSGSAVNGATVEIRDNDSNWILNLTTNASGLTTRRIFTQSWRNVSYNATKTPHNVSVTRSGYATNSTLITLNISKRLDISLSKFSCVNPGNRSTPYYIDLSTPLCTGTYYINSSANVPALWANSDNLMVDCNGSTLIGNSSADSIGIYVNSSFSNVTIKNCNVSGYATGIYLYGNANHTVRNNTLGPIINFSIHANRVNTSLIIDNTVFNSTQSGIVLTSCRYTNMTNNTVYNNSGQAIVIQYSNNSRALGNNVSNNPGEGCIVLSGNSNTVANNTFSFNGQAGGITLMSTTNANVTLNTIFNNTEGIYRTGTTSGSIILYNNIYDNSVYNFLNAQADNVNATYNYWGSTNCTAINASIYDWGHNSSRGNVTWSPFYNSSYPGGTLMSCSEGPVGLSVVLNSDNSSINLNWSTVGDADLYCIYSHMNASFALNSSRLNASHRQANATGSSNTTWNDTDAGENRTLYYRVSAVTGGAESFASDTVGKFNISIVPSNLSGAEMNLISMPLQIQNDSISTLIPIAPSNLTTITYYMANYTPPRYVSAFYKDSAWLGILTELNARRGFVVTNTQGFNFTLVGTVPTDEQTVTINATNSTVGQLEVNTVGWYSSIVQCDLNGTLNETNMAAGDTVSYYNASSLAFETITKDANGWTGDFGCLQPGKGYFFTAANNYTWTYNST